MALPEEIILEEIFTWLPIISLIRFRCVCKLWNSLLSDPDFTQSHLNRSCVFRNPNDENLILYNFQFASTKYLSILSRADFSETRLDKLVPCPSSNQHTISLVGSINGLVCITCFYASNRHFILWNPATRLSKKILIPNFQRTVVDKERLIVFGLGWDSLTNDYKLIAKPSDQFFVYSCKTDCWSKKVVTNLSPPPNIMSSGSPNIIVKGVPYWELCNITTEILRFDVRSNEFTYLKVSPSFKCYSLIDLNDSLALINYACYEADADVYCYNEECNLWNKMYTITKRIGQDISACFKYGGGIVFNGKNDFYDPKSDEIKSLAHHDKGYYVHGFSYTPSLLAIEGMKSLHP